MTAPARADGGTRRPPGDSGPRTTGRWPAQPGRVKDFLKGLFRRGNRTPAPAPQPTRPRANTDYANPDSRAMAKVRVYQNEGLDPTPYGNIPEFLAASTPPPPLPQMTRQPVVAPHTAPQALRQPGLYAELQRRLQK